MIYKEEQRDLFLVPDKYYFAQCISADFGMGKGIAVEFNKHFNTKQNLLEKYPATRIPYWDKLQDRFKGMCELDGRVLNLITKRKYWGKPTYKTMTNALIWMKEICDEQNIQKIAMPKIGCGLDKLEWSKVSNIIKEVFKDTDCEILVCFI